MNKLLIILVLILAVAVVYFAFLKDSGFLMHQILAPKPTPVGNSVVDWKTYSNTQYGFEFKYPEDFKLSLFPDKFFVNKNDVGSFGVYLTQNILGADGIKPAPLQEGRKYNLDGKQIFAYVQEDNLSGLPEPRRYILISIDRSDQQLWIIGTFPINKPESEELIGKFISTFKFINSDPIITWKTFTDKQGRFEVKYPSEFNLDYSEAYPAGEYRVFGVNDVGGSEPYLYFSIYAKPERIISEEKACREAGGGYIRKYYMNERIQIEGQNYLKCYYDREFQKDQALFISFNRNGYRWEFLAIHYDKYRAVIEQIISTFKYLK